jgi:hypothetical protein
MGAPIDKVGPDGVGERKKPFDMIGFSNPNHKNPEREELAFIDHELRENWQTLENKVIRVAQKPKTPRVKDQITMLNAQITKSVIAVDVVGWLCKVYDIALINTNNRPDGWKVDTIDMWKEVNYHWNLTTPPLQDRLEVYYKKLLAMKELELWDDRESFGAETTGFEL